MQAPTQALGNMLRAPTQIIENTYNLYCNPQGKRRLPNDFQPGPYDVICARGKKAHDSEGNVRFRALVEQHQEEYAKCTCKYEKSKIVSFITNSIRQACAYHQGGFVKNVDGLWYEVGDRAAKEKIGQTFRDLLHTKYSSSTKAKAKARIEKRLGEQGDEDNSEQQDQEEVETAGTAKMKRKSSFGMNIKLPAFAKNMNPLRSSFKLTSAQAAAGSATEEKKEPGPSFTQPDKPLSDEKVLDHLRSSVQTVDSDFRMSTLSLNGMTEEDWMKLSTNSNPMSNPSFASQFTSSHPHSPNRGRPPSQLAMSMNPEINPPIVDISQAMAFRHDESHLHHQYNQNDDDANMDDFMMMTDNHLHSFPGDHNNNNPNPRESARPYGIFSSSTKSNPFSESMLLSSSVNSRNNPMLRSINSARSSITMEMDLDGLLESMGSINMMEGAHNNNDL